MLKVKKHKKELIMKNIILLIALFGSLAVNAKTLSVSCKENGKSLEVVSEIKNVNTPQDIKSLIVNGETQDQVKDVSSMPIYNGGNLSIQLQFGSRLYSSANFELQKCNDDFEATGVAELKEYIGGFAGTSFLNMPCTCSIK
jgi:hypothetical protein